MLKVKDFVFETELVSIKDRNDVDYIVQNVLSVDDGHMVVWYGYAVTDVGNYLLDTGIGDMLDIEYLEFAKLIADCGPVSHPHDCTEINCFNESNVKKFAKELKKILIREGRWIGN